MTTDIEAKKKLIAAWPRERLEKLACDLLDEVVMLEHRIEAARELLNEYRRGLK